VTLEASVRAFRVRVIARALGNAGQAGTDGFVERQQFRRRFSTHVRGLKAALDRYLEFHTQRRGLSHILDA